MALLRVVKLAYFLVSSLRVGGVELDQYGWCNINDKYVKFNNSEACVECGGVTTIKMREEMKSLRCCADGKLEKKCLQDDIPCEDGGYFPMSSKCDQIKDCVNGRDEENCMTDCQYFTCSNGTKKDYCVDMDLVCNGEKNCVSGLDETNCIYSGGRCTGYLCPVSHQCISMDKVCDMSKDCLTGADEVNCWKFSTLDTFECGDGNGFDSQTICDGLVDCTDGQDEDNCYMWTTWTEWSECKCFKNGNSTGTRNRTCVTSNLSTAPSENCIGKNREENNIACDCWGSEDPKSQAMIYVTIVIAVVLVLAIGLIILNMVMRHKRAWLSYAHTTISIRNHTTESLIGQSNDELSDERQGTPPHSQYTVRRLPATPPSRLQNFSSIQFGRRTSIHDNIREGYQSSILAPSEGNSTQHDMVENPLYHTYREENTVYSHLSVLNSSENEQKSPSRLSRVDDDENEHDLAIMDQIQVAQMGNLIEMADFNIN